VIHDFGDAIHGIGVALFRPSMFGCNVLSGKYFEVKQGPERWYGDCSLKAYCLVSRLAH